jgi:transaldolase
MARRKTGAAAMATAFGGNRLIDLQSLGQSIWLDELHRSLLVHAQLTHLIHADGISGVTSNPTILAKAFAEDIAYREPIATLRAAGATGQQIYERLCIEDISRAADQLRRVYENSNGRDGYVSIEVSPVLANDANGTVSEARRLWSAIDKPNVMIKVPATDSGLLAIRQLIAAGVSINATLIFGTRRYREVAEAYLLGLEDRVAESRPLERVASVASLFVSRIDTLIDRQLDAIQHPEQLARAQRLRGRVAVAVARFAYQKYKGFIASPRWQPLAARNAQTQRLLWASTGTKDAHYSDVKYVNELIGRDTVNTMPMNTLNAYRDHGATAPTLEKDLLEVVALLGEVETLDINLEQVSMDLEREGLVMFSASMKALLTQLESAG